jgi:hypothetical protein
MQAWKTIRNWPICGPKSGEFNMHISRVRNWTIASLLAISIPLTSMADEDYELLKQQVEILQSQLAEVQQALKQYENQSASKE